MRTFAAKLLAEEALQRTHSLDITLRRTHTTADRLILSMSICVFDSDLHNPHCPVCRDNSALDAHIEVLKECLGGLVSLRNDFPRYARRGHVGDYLLTLEALVERGRRALERFEVLMRACPDAREEGDEECPVM